MGNGDKMNRVLIVMMHLGMGGAEKSLVNFLNTLKNDDCEVDLLLFKKEGVLLKYLPDWVRVIDTPSELAVLYGRRPHTAYECILSLKRLFGTFISNILTCHGERRGFVRWKHFYKKSISNLDAHYDTAISYVSGECMYYVVEKVNSDYKYTWVHTDYKACGGVPDDDRVYFMKLDNVITISEKCVESIQVSIPELKNVVCLPNIVSSNFILKQGEEMIVEKIDNSIFKIISIGRLEYVKGFDLAVEAARVLKQRNFKFNWYIIGDGSQKTVLEKKIVEYGLEEMFLLGMKENPYPYLAMADLMVQPSRFEGKSIALDEAKIFGKPIVATAYPSVKDQLNENEGLIVNMIAEDIAHGIEQLAVDKKLYDKIEAYLKGHEYGNAHIVTDYLKLLQLN